jgi:aconitase A
LAKIAGFGGQFGDLPLPWAGDNHGRSRIKSQREICDFSRLEENDQLPSERIIMPKKLTSPVYVVQDDIDTDQIIPAQYLALVPTIPDEYEKLGSYAMAGLPSDLYPIEFIKKDSMKTEYKIVIAGKNFGCGSSREHAPISLGAAGVEVIVADSYARIFFRNSVATGELYP